MSARPGFSFCVCPDSRLTREELDKALAAHPAADGRAWERHVFWGDEPLPPLFWEHLTLQGLFASPKVILLHNAQNLPAESWKRLSAILAKNLGETWPFFSLQAAFEKGRPKIPAHISKLACFEFAAKKGWLWSSPGLLGRSKLDFIRARAEKSGLSFAPGALEAISARLSNDASAILLELDKLALAANPGLPLTLEAARLLDYEPEPDIFSLIRGLQEKGAALGVWKQVLARRGTESMCFAFLALLLREARQLWQLRYGDLPYLPAAVLAAKQNMSMSLGFGGISALWQLALGAEKAIKSGEMDVDQAMDDLIAGLFKVFRKSL